MSGSFAQVLKEQLELTCYSVEQLQISEEVERLRSIYPNFFMLGVFAEEEKRLDYLENQLGIPFENAKKLIA